MPLTRQKLAEMADEGWATREIRGLFETQEEFEGFLLAPLGTRERNPPLRYTPPYDGERSIETFLVGGLPQPGLNPGRDYTKMISIEYTGTRGGDFDQANNYYKYDKTPDGYVWHHFHDYDHETNRGTMYLMLVEHHEDYHWGGVSQYCYANDKAYG